MDDDAPLPEIVSKLKLAVDLVVDKLSADVAFKIFEEAASIKMEGSGKEYKKWEITALSLVLQHSEAGCMQSAIEYLGTVHKILPASLIHDGLLIEADKWPEDPNFLEHVSQAVTSRVGFTVRFARKAMEMEEKHVNWLRLVKENTRFCRRGTPSELTYVEDLMVKAAKTPTHFTVAKVVHGIHPKKLVYTDTKSQWFLIEAPRWRDIGGNISFIVSMIDNEILPHFQRFQERISSGELYCQYRPCRL